MRPIEISTLMTANLLATCSDESGSAEANGAAHAIDDTVVSNRSARTGSRRRTAKGTRAATAPHFPAATAYYPDSDDDDVDGTAVTRRLIPIARPAPLGSHADVEGWIDEGKSPASGRPAPFRIGLKRRNLEVLVKRLDEAQGPVHTQRDGGQAAEGPHQTPMAIPGASDAVRAWLNSVLPHASLDISATNIHVENVTLRDIERLYRTTFHQFRDPISGQVKDYTVAPVVIPDEIKEYVDIPIVR